MDRRDFLRHSAFFVVASAATPAIAGPEDERGHGGRERTPLRVDFPQGVASGDPKPHSVVFWSRCVPVAPEAPAGADAWKPPAAFPVTLVVSTDARCERVIARVRLVASADYDYTVRAKLTHLAPGRTYHYRFIAGRSGSPIGRARTAPAMTALPAELRFAWLSCQDWSVNHWAGMSLLAEEELDFVVHVGDYIYETVGASFQAGKAEPAHPAIVFPDGTTLPDGSRAAETLADYRQLYRTYRSDPRLQAVHARFPMIAVWDDHEFSDDAWRDHDTYTNANPQRTARRRAANQAWVEYMPVDFGDVAFDPLDPAYDNLRIYRDFRFGRLMHLVMTDERLYRDDHVVPEAVVAQLQGHDPINGSDSIGARYFIQQPVLQQFEAVRTAELGRVPSILGETQTAWFKDTMKGAKAVWKVWGNELMLSRLWLDLTQSAPPPFNARYVVNGDAWDGFAAHRADLLGFLKEHDVRNVVAITGDLHAFQCGVVRDLPDPQAGTPVLVDFVGAGVSSSSFYSYVRAGAAGTPLEALTASPPLFDAILQLNNPDFAYVDHDAQGYATAVVTRDKLEVTFHKMRKLNEDGSVPEPALLKRTRFTLLEGTTTPTVEDDV